MWACLHCGAGKSVGGRSFIKELTLASIASGGRVVRHSVWVEVSSNKTFMGYLKYIMLLRMSCQKLVASPSSWYVIILLGMRGTWSSVCQMLSV